MRLPAALPGAGFPTAAVAAVREGVACFQAWRADEAGNVTPALGVKYVLDERRRVFSVSGRLCTAAAWETGRVVWRNTVKSLPISAGAPTKATPRAYTVWLVEQALARYERDGPEATLDHYNSPEALDGPWYVFVLEDRDGALYSVANSNRPDLVGTTRERIDANGYDYGAAFAQTVDGEGQWVSYLFTHPITRQDAPKHTWIARRGNLLFGAGWYEGIN